MLNNIIFTKRYYGSTLIKSTKRNFLLFCLMSFELIILGIYLCLFRFGFEVDPVFFWISSLSYITTLLFFILLDGKDEINKYSLFTFLCFLWLIKSVFVPVTIPLFGSDPYVSLAATESFAGQGWSTIVPWSNTGDISWSQERNYPFLAGVSIAITKLAGLRLDDWARWGGTIISLFSVLLVLGITYEIYNSAQTAFLGAVGFGITYYFVMFQSLYIKETISFFLFLAVLYSLLLSEKIINVGGKLLPMFLILAIILSHHLTSLMLSLFVLLLLLIKIFLVEKKVSKPYTKINWSLLIYLLVAMLTYWIYLKYTPIRIVDELLKDAFTESIEISIGSMIPHTWRYILTLLLQTISAIVFGILAVIGYIKFRVLKPVWQAVSILWGGSLGVLAFLGIAGAFGKLGSFPARLEIYGYVLLIPAAAHAVVKIKDKYKITGIALGIFIFFIYFCSSLLRIGPYLYSNTEPNVAAGETSAVLKRSEYDLISKIKPNVTGIIAGPYRGPARKFNLTSYIWQGDSNSNTFVNIDYVVTSEAEKDLLENANERLENQELDLVYNAGSGKIFVPRISGNWKYSFIQNHPNQESFVSLQFPRNLIQGWFFVLIFLAIYSSFGSVLIGYYLPPGAGNKVTDLAGSALSFCIGLIFLFAGFLVYDFSRSYHPITIIIPLITATGAVLIISIKKKRLLVSVNRVVILLLFVFVFSSVVFELLSINSTREPYTVFYLDSWSGDKKEGVVSVINKGYRTNTYKIEGWVKDKKFIDTEVVAILPGGKHDFGFSITKDVYINSEDSLLARFVLNGQQDLSVWVSQ